MNEIDKIFDSLRCTKEDMQKAKQMMDKMPHVFRYTPGSLVKLLHEKPRLNVRLEKYHLDVSIFENMCLVHVDRNHDRCPAEKIILDTGEHEIYSQFYLENDEWNTCGKIFQVSMDADCDMCYLMSGRLWARCLMAMVVKIK